MTATTSEIKKKSQVDKVLSKIKKKQTKFKSVQDKRIAHLIANNLLKRECAPHPKMRMHDVEQIHNLLKRTMNFDNSVLENIYQSVLCDNDNNNDVVETDSDDESDSDDQYDLSNDSAVYDSLNNLNWSSDDQEGHHTLDEINNDASDDSVYDDYIYTNGDESDDDNIYDEDGYIHSNLSDDDLYEHYISEDDEF